MKSERGCFEQEIAEGTETKEREAGLPLNLSTSFLDGRIKIKRRTNQEANETVWISKRRRAGKPRSAKGVAPISCTISHLSTAEFRLLPGEKLGG
jgi:hypothetical protein